LFVSLLSVYVSFFFPWILLSFIVIHIEDFEEFENFKDICFREYAVLIPINFNGRVRLKFSKIKSFGPAVNISFDSEQKLLYFKKLEDEICDTNFVRTNIAHWRSFMDKTGEFK